MLITWLLQVSKLVKNNSETQTHLKHVDLHKMSHLRCVIVAVYSIHWHWLIECGLVQTGSALRAKESKLMKQKTMYVDTIH